MTVLDRQREQDLARRMFSVENAIAHQRLEGLTVSPKAVEDMRRVADDEMTSDQAIQRVQARLHHAALLGS